MEYIAIGLICLAIAVVGFAEGMATTKALESTGRNPDAASKIRTTLIVGCALVETCAIYSLVIAILLIFTKM